MPMAKHARKWPSLICDQVTSPPTSAQDEVGLCETNWWEPANETSVIIRIPPLGRGR